MPQHNNPPPKPGAIPLPSAAAPAPHVRRGAIMVNPAQGAGGMQSWTPQAQAIWQAEVAAAERRRAEAAALAAAPKPVKPAHAGAPKSHVARLVDFGLLPPDPPPSAGAAAAAASARNASHATAVALQKAATGAAMSAAAAAKPVPKPAGGSSSSSSSSAVAVPSPKPAVSAAAAASVPPSQAAAVIAAAEAQKAQAAAAKVHARRQLLKRYVDRAFAKEDRIMTAAKITSSGVAAGIDYVFPFATLIAKGIESPTCAGVRADRRRKAQMMYAKIDSLSPASLEKVVGEANVKDNGDPGFNWLNTRLDQEGGASSASSISAVGAAGSAAASVVASEAASIAQDVFMDYIADAVLDQALSFIPWGGGAIVSGVKNGAALNTIEGRITALDREIQALKAKAQ